MDEEVTNPGVVAEETPPAVVPTVEPIVEENQWAELTEDERKERANNIGEYVTKLALSGNDMVDAIYINPTNDIFIDFLEMWEDIQLGGGEAPPNGDPEFWQKLKDSIQLIPEEKVPISGYNLEDTKTLPGVTVTTRNQGEFNRLVHWARGEFEPLMQKHQKTLPFNLDPDSLKLANLVFNIVHLLVSEYREVAREDIKELVQAELKNSSTGRVVMPTYTPNSPGGPGGYQPK